ncbi:MAG: ComEC/Rec2 family competence protein [Thermosynechococcaceae cyanobacterium MS004]|nr:ComEC/Rec2 family competence protein [Thermosynechococcaceae cyanobacterium MS004]
MAAIALFCCAYILGLLCTSLPGYGLWLSGVWAGLALIRRHYAFQSWIHRQTWFLPQWRSSLPSAQQFLIAALLSLFAAGYLQLRLPQPGFQDVSRLLPADQNSLTLQVTGTIERRPSLTRRGSVQLWLEVQTAQFPQAALKDRSQKATGKLYVTLPRKAAKNLAPGQAVTLTGQLYRPKGATRPRGYDFKSYLAREGAFAGLRATQAEVHSPSGWTVGWSGGGLLGLAIRDRIVQSLIQGTDGRTGPLLSALVLGKDAADIAHDLKDDFIQAGLAHALAASGFQVSLILSAVLTLGRSLPTARRMGVGFGALLFYGLLSGAEPSIVRAILMGCASLVALGLERKTRPVALLLMVAVVMLIYNPLWIWDLGFQLSMLATLGLMVTVPPLMESLDWLPTPVASLVAVPLAATIWTLPLQLYIFGILPIYSLVANVLTALLLSVLTIGGLLASCGALLWPLLGSGLAGLLFWPLQLLIAIVSGISQLPGHALALGSISRWQLLALYGCIGGVWLLGKTQWRLMMALGLLVLLVPLWHVKSQRFLVTVFDESRIPLMVIERPNSTVVINSGDRLSATQSLLPFLQREGINRIDWAIATDSVSLQQSGWSALLSRLPITTLSRSIPQAIAQAESGRSSPQPQQQIDVTLREPMTLGALRMVLWRAQPTILEIDLDAIAQSGGAQNGSAQATQRWLLVDNSNEADFSAWLSTVQLPPIRVLWWTGSSVSAQFSAQVLEKLRPQTLILSAKRQDPTVVSTLKQRIPQLFWTAQDGTLQWTPTGFSTTVNPGDNNLAPL